MLTKAERVLAVREGGWTDRMHTVHKSRRYGVDGHSWGVATLAHTMFPEDTTKDLLLACLYHDVPERWVGDTPHPAKRNFNPRFGEELHKAEEMFMQELDLVVELTEREEQILKFCDMLEFVLWSWEEVRMGNTLMEGSFTHSMKCLKKMDLYEEVEDVMMNLIRPGASESENWWKDLMNVQG